MDISKTIYEMADKTVKGAEKLTETAKLKYKISSVKAKLDSYYKSIGELKYAEHFGEKVTEDMYEGLFAEVYEKELKLKELQKQLDGIRQYTVCKNCGQRFGQEFSFCPRCGEKAK